MAQTDRFMIAPINTGLQTDLRPWLIADDAYSALVNAYVFRGRVRKRFGTIPMNGSVASGIAQQYTRFKVLLGNVNAMTGAFTATVPGAINPAFFGQMFSLGNDMFTVPSLGTPVTMLTTSATITGTFNTTNGSLSIVGAPLVATPVYFYPGLPVMGLVTYEDSMINSEPVFGFDTDFAYTYSTGALSSWSRSTAEAAESPGSSIWTGTDSQFFWGYTYRGILASAYFLFVTNFNAPDRLRYWDANAWNYLNPVLNGTFRLLTCRIVVPFKNRLVCLNTIENAEGIIVVSATNSGTGNWTYPIPGYSYVPGQAFVVGTTVYTIISTMPYVTVSAIPTNATIPSATFVPATGVITVTGNGFNAGLPVYFLNNTTVANQAFVNRARFSQNGSPVSGNAWIDNVNGLGGFTDAPTKEQIVTAGFLKDRLIVYFESSTWELAYSGNQLEPFIWQQINTELGAESTFSAVPFDKNLIAVGNVGIHSCSGTNVERIDGNIPDEVFDVSNDNAGVFRVYGIRDYYAEMVYWTFPSDTDDAIYPDRVLVYNYKTGAWAFNYDTITAFGYYQNQTNQTWENCSLTWEEMIMQWNSGTLDTNFRQIIAGNQQGFVNIVRTDVPRNAPSLIISAMSLTGNLLQLTVINHNLTATASVQEADGAYVIIENALVNTTPPIPPATIGIPVVVAPLTINGMIFPTYQVVDVNNIIIAVDPTMINGAYIGAGTLAQVSNINITTKQYNFYVQEGRDAAINKVDFLVDKTAAGAVTVDYYVSSSDESTLQSAVTGALMGTCVLETFPYPLIPLESTQDRLWHPMYPQANGECIQLNIYMSDTYDLANSQIRNPDIAFSDFQLGAMTFYTQKTGRLQ